MQSEYATHVWLASATDLQLGLTVDAEGSQSSEKNYLVALEIVMQLSKFV